MKISNFEPKLSTKNFEFAQVTVSSFWFSKKVCWIFAKKSPHYLDKLEWWFLSYGKTVENVSNIDRLITISQAYAELRAVK